MTVQIRAASEDDLGELAALDRRVIDASFRPLLGDAVVDAFLAGGEVERFLEGTPGRCWLAQEDGSVLGAVVVDGARIDLLMVEAARQGQGLGGALLQTAEAALFPNHAELELHSFAVNERANAFYRRHGWREESRFFEVEAGTDTIVFKKTAPLAPG